MIKIYIDYLKGSRFLETKLRKTSEYIIAGSLLLYKIDEIRKKLRCNISIDYVKGYPKKVLQFKNDLAAFLIDECDWIVK